MDGADRDALPKVAGLAAKAGGRSIDDRTATEPADGQLKQRRRPRARLYRVQRRGKFVSVTLLCIVLGAAVGGCSGGNTGSATASLPTARSSTTSGVSSVPKPSGSGALSPTESSNSTAVPTSAPTTEVCSLLTVAEAQSILGKPTSVSQEIAISGDLDIVAGIYDVYIRPQFSDATCDWVVDAKKPADGLIVIRRIRLSSDQKAKFYFGFGRGGNSNLDKDLTGIGDQAYWVPHLEHTFSSAVWVLKGSEIFTVDMLLAGDHTDQDEEAAESEVARAAAAR
jgi:hypothetical protein